MTRPDPQLRRRRLALGASQFLIGCLAGWPPAGAQSTVSAIENGKGASSERVRRVRAALVWLEAEPRRRREWQRVDDAAAATVERAIAGDDMLAAEAVVVERLVDLLLEGRAEEFDILAARVPASFADVAGERYLDACTPQIPNAAAGARP